MRLKIAVIIYLFELYIMLICILIIEGIFHNKQKIPQTETPHLHIFYKVKVCFRNKIVNYKQMIGIQSN